MFICRCDKVALVFVIFLFIYLSVWWWFDSLSLSLIYVTKWPSPMPNLQHVILCYDASIWLLANTHFFLLNFYCCWSCYCHTKWCHTKLIPKSCLCHCQEIRLVDRWIMLFWYVCSSRALWFVSHFPWKSFAFRTVAVHLLHVFFIAFHTNLFSFLFFLLLCHFRFIATGGARVAKECFIIFMCFRKKQNACFISQYGKYISTRSLCDLYELTRKADRRTFILTSK